jgi:hypothetical protein
VLIVPGVFFGGWYCDKMPCPSFKQLLQTSCRQGYSIMEEPKGQPYVIRIHAAWERVEVDASGAISAPMRIMLPDENPIAESTEFMVYTRRFNCPSGLSDKHRVDLECELLNGACTATVNKHFLSETDGAASIEITHLLKPHNELKFKLPSRQIESARVATAKLRITTL